jgi:hypothetical protein
MSFLLLIFDVPDAQKHTGPFPPPVGPLACPSWLLLLLPGIF